MQMEPPVSSVEYGDAKSVLMIMYALNVPTAYHFSFKMAMNIVMPVLNHA